MSTDFVILHVQCIIWWGPSLIDRPGGGMARLAPLGSACVSTVQAQLLSRFSHVARVDDSADAKTMLAALPPEDSSLTT